MDVDNLLSEIVLTEQAQALILFDSNGLCLGRKGQLSTDLELFVESLAVSRKLSGTFEWKGKTIAIKTDPDYTLALIYPATNNPASK